MKKSKKIVIIRAVKGRKYASYIAREVRQAGYFCGITSIRNLKKYLQENKCLPGQAIIHSRTAHPGFTYRVLKDVENQGYRVVNPSEAIRLTSDKFESCVYAKEKNIPCAETLKIQKHSAIPFVRDRIKEWREIVVKPLTSQGQGEFCFKFNKDNSGQIEKINGIPCRELVVQKFINYQRLNRVIVIGRRALEKAVFWDAPDQGWKCSVCLNPKIKCYKKPPKDLLEFAEDIAKKFKAEISFIDIFSTKNGYFLNEINTACSLIIHQKVSECNIARKIAVFLLSKRS